MNNFFPCFSWQKLGTCVPDPERLDKHVFKMPKPLTPSRCRQRAVRAAEHRLREAARFDQENRRVVIRSDLIQELSEVIEDLRRKEQQEPAETNRHERVSSPLLDHTHHVRIVGCPIKDPPVKFIILAGSRQNGFTLPSVIKSLTLFRLLKPLRRI